jgi:phosphatidylglycerol:prolipoprotein diacylglycerol transferase
MRQILFEIPIWLPFYGWASFPLFGYGAMLLLAYFACTWLCKRLGRRVGIAPDVFTDMILWLFVSGVIGARIAYFVFEARGDRSIGHFFTIWDGGLVFYGSIVGAVIGYFIVDRALQKKYGLDRWKLLDCVAPAIALGLALGRIGCLLNGCCYGEVACERCPSISFPLSGAPRMALVDRGVQTTAGFTLDSSMQRQVDFVEPGSRAAAAGLQAGDLIVKVNGKDVIDHDKEDREIFKLHEAFRGGWPRGVNDLQLTVESLDGQTRDLPAFCPWTVGLHPTQIYETISMTLMLFFLVSYFPYRRADGELMVILMFGYAIHRFLNEMLRSDNEIWPNGLTLSQNISVLVFACAVVLAIAVYRHARQQS